MNWQLKLILFFSSSLLTGTLCARNLDKAPPSFQFGGKRLVPIDFQHVDLELEFDVQNNSHSAVATIRFKMSNPGYPMFDLVPEISSATLDGQSVDIETAADPHFQTYVRFANKKVTSPNTHTLSILYNLDSSDITFAQGGVRVGFFMGDVGTENQRGFLERYAPANFEYDQFSMSLSAKVQGAQSNHRVFTNGLLKRIDSEQFEVDFPSYFTSSSFYFHLSNRQFYVDESLYSGVDREFPLVLYSHRESLVRRALPRARAVLKELEQTYGSYVHASMTAYITGEEGGGMEHVGATITSLWALEHEFTHSWFARGVMPSDGNSGWIDEAIASWRDNGYPTHSTPPFVFSVNLANFSPYRRTTPTDSYTLGARLIAHLDYLFRSQGGMKPLLKDLFSAHQKETITTAQFQRFVQNKSTQPLESLFQRYVMGGREKPVLSQPRFSVANLSSHAWEQAIWPSKHPRPLTKKEMTSLR